MLHQCCIISVAVLSLWVADLVAQNRLRLRNRGVAATLTGLDFPDNGSGTTRFNFTGAALPPAIQPLTVIWRVYPRQQTGYHTTFFYAEINGDLGGGGGSGVPGLFTSPYFGCHPYPQGGAGGTVHNWEIAIQSQDIIADDNSNSTVVTKEQWYSQAAISTAVGSQLRVQFYWDLETSSTRIISWTSDTSTLGGYLNWEAPEEPGMVWGDAPWNANAELLNGILRGMQIYTSALTLSQINLLREAESDTEALAIVASESITSLWYLNINPTPSDISDKSGSGHHPSWFGANRPTLWSQ